MPAFRLQRALRTFGVAFSVGSYTVLAPFGYLAFALLCWWWRNRPLRCARRLQRCTGWGFRFLHNWLWLVRVAKFDYRRALPELPDGPCVIVANHPTQLDVTAMGARLRGACTIVKPTIYRRRLLRPLMVGAGLLEGPGQDPISVGSVIDQGVQRLRDGMRIFVFPEGTRSPPGSLRRFGRVAFEIACRAGVPLVSVGIRCDPIWLTREVPLYRPPHPMPELRMTMLAVDDAAAHRDSRALRDLVEARYRGWLAAGAPLSAAPCPPCQCGQQAEGR